MRTICACCGRPLQPELQGRNYNPKAETTYCSSCKIAGCPSSLRSVGKCSRNCPGVSFTSCTCCGAKMPSAVHIKLPRHKDDKEFFHGALPNSRKRCDRCVILGCNTHGPSRRCPSHPKNRGLDKPSGPLYTLSQKGRATP